MRLLGTFAILAVTASATAAVARRSFPAAWTRWVKRTYVALLVLALAGTLAWVVGRSTGAYGLYMTGMVISSSLLVASFVLFLTVPLWGSVAWGSRRLAERTVDPRRRAFLTRASGVLPLAAAATGPAGTTASMLSPVLRRVDVSVPDLPPALEGLTLLQLTDVHLGTFIDVDQVERVVEAARPLAPDLVVLTGDVADDLDKLGPALKSVASLAPPLGAFAIYGNHEVYRGREENAAIYAQSPVRLLCEEGVVLERDGARLWLGGCDDPATLGRKHRDFLRDTVRATMKSCPDDVGVRILLSHRPEGFEEAARHKVTLTLSGHTHGAQMAVFGRSLLEPVLPKNYLLGPYSVGDSHLYTSAGLGHWFPFRFNCPCEAALITLRAARGPAGPGDGPNSESGAGRARGGISVT